MVVGFALMVLIGYNGIIDKPGSGPAEVGVSLDYGYWVALLARSRSRRRDSCARRPASGDSARPRAPSDAIARLWAMAAEESSVISQDLRPARSRTETWRWSWCASPRPRRSPRRAGSGRGEKEAGGSGRGRRDAAAARHGAHGRPRRDRRGGEGRGADALQRRADRRRQPARGGHRGRPLEGTTLTARGMPSALAVIALAERGTMFDPGPCVYMEKLAGGPDIADLLSLDEPLPDVIRKVAERKGVEPADVTVIMLDRPRHAEQVDGDPRGRRADQVHHRRRRLGGAVRRLRGHRRRPALGHRRHARRACCRRRRSSAWAASSSAGSGRATTTSARPRSTPATTSTRCSTSDRLVAGERRLLRGHRGHRRGAACRGSATWTTATPRRSRW